MSVIVKGMDMPERCSECELYDVMAQNKKAVEFCRFNMRPLPDDEERASWCPLVPLPEKHGRLIDADKAVKRFRGAQKTQKDDSKSSGWICHGLEIAIDIISSTDFPTIIEAEGGGEDGQS